MIGSFEFQDAGRHYSCTVERQPDAGAEAWWWFAVSGDQQRYAPFRAAKGDTRADVQARIVEFYANRLFRLSQPVQRGSHWGKRSPGPGKTAEPGAPPA